MDERIQILKEFADRFDTGPAYPLCRAMMRRYNCKRFTEMMEGQKNALMRDIAFFTLIFTFKRQQ